MIKNKIATTQPAKNEVKPTRDLREKKSCTQRAITKISTFTSTCIISGIIDTTRCYDTT